MDLECAIQYEAEWFEATRKTDGAEEGFKAFLDKRTSEFNGKGKGLKNWCEIYKSPNGDFE